LIIDVVARVGLVMSGAYLITTRIREALIVRMVPSRERVGRGHGPLLRRDSALVGVPVAGMARSYTQTRRCLFL
jgi:hypothetical protein